MNYNLLSQKLNTKVNTSEVFMKDQASEGGREGGDDIFCLKKKLPDRQLITRSAFCLVTKLMYF